MAEAYVNYALDNLELNRRDAVYAETRFWKFDKSTFTRLMDFVDLFPHYFIGCNAPLPRIGGSVLAHDYYQGGGEILPMHRAKAAFVLKCKARPEVAVEVADWAGTVVRIISKNRSSIEDI